MFALRAICDHFFVVAHSLQLNDFNSVALSSGNLPCVPWVFLARLPVSVMSVPVTRAFSSRLRRSCWRPAAEAKRSEVFLSAARKWKPLKPGVRTTETRNQTKNKTSCAPSSGKSYLLEKKGTRMEFQNIHRKQGRFCRLWKTFQGATSRLSDLEKFSLIFQVCRL